MNAELQDFPVDAETLDLLEASMTTAGPDGSTCFASTLDLLAGVDPLDSEAREAHTQPVIIDGTYHDGIMEDDRPSYHHHDVILALIAEVRRLRESHPAPVLGED